MPLRRYLRISKYSTLEVRVYVTGATQTWFTEGMLREAIRLIKPLVLPKLREERAAKKKKKPTKDNIRGDGFEASVFLQDVQTKHAVLDVNKSLVFVEGAGSKATTNPAANFGDSSPLFIPSQDDEDEDIKDKPILRTNYEGFTIYGKALWLVVSPTSKADLANQAQTALLDNWITMTQQEEPHELV